MPEEAEHVGEGIALVSLHEVSPAFEDDIVKMCDLLDEMGLARVTLLVTPFYDLKRINTFEKNPTLAEYLLSLDHELSLHGYTHISSSGSRAEFADLSLARLNSRMLYAVNMFEKAFGKRPIGIVPPRWQAPRNLYNVSRSLNLRYTVIGDMIHYHTKNRVLATAASVISLGERIVDVTRAVVEMELKGPLQVALHPRDHANENVMNLLFDLMDRLGYRMMGYWDYLSSL